MTHFTGECFLRNLHLEFGLKWNSDENENKNENEMRMKMRKKIRIDGKAPIFCLLKLISFLIITKSVENLKQIWRLRIHVGMDEMYEIVHQTMYRLFGIDEMYKLVIDEMYEIVWIWISWNWLKFEYEYSKICLVPVVRAQTLC